MPKVTIVDKEIEECLAEKELNFTATLDLKESFSGADFYTYFHANQL